MTRETMKSISLVSALLTLSNSSSYGVVGYIHSKTPLSQDELPKKWKSSTRIDQVQVPSNGPEITNILTHDRIQYEPSSSMESSSTISSSSSSSLPQPVFGIRRTEPVAFVSSNPITINPSPQIPPPPSAELSIPTTTATINPLEAWCLSHMDTWYTKSQSVKCPFLRRRMGDLLDKVENVMKHTVIRRECWPLMGPPQAWRPAGHNKKLRRIKYKNLPLEDVKQYVYNDWKPDTGKGYYVTGKLTTAIYRDDCLFLGPDPDMPIKGLRKYIGVAAHLFDFDESVSTLKSLEIVDDDNTLVAEWQLKGILKLPWRPHLPTFSGKTVYYFDDEGLIERHEESWDMTVAHAFCQTLFPDLAAKIWKEHNNDPAVATTL